MKSFRSQNECEENVNSDIKSGVMIVANKLGDKIPEFLKEATESFIRRSELIAKAMIQRQSELEQAITIAQKVNDKNAYYSSLFQLSSINFKDTAKLVDAGEYSWLIDKSFEYSKASKFIEVAGKKAIQYLPAFFKAYSIKEAYKRASDGDYFGACLKVADVGLSFFPGLSMGYSLIPTGISLIYDYLK